MSDTTPLHDFYNLPVEVIPKERLGRYIKTVYDSSDVVLNRYTWNIALSEALYPTYALLEVTLRNRIDNAICNYYGENWLDSSSKFWTGGYYPLTQLQEYRTLMETRKRLDPQKTRGHLIAELTLGFWTGLFKNSYKPQLWSKRKFFDSVFPDCPMHVMDRIAVVQPILRKARILRNRISHHEAIFDMPNLAHHVAEVQATVAWLSKDALVLLKHLDRFAEIYRGFSVE